MKHLFIINPKAGKGKALSYVEKIHNLFKYRSDEYEIVLTEKVGHATEIVRLYTSRSTYRIYSIGGDGTLNEVLNGIVNTDSSLGIIPAGSGNDFIRSLIGNEKLEDILIKTIEGSCEYIDIATVNERYFLNISSIGFDAEVVSNARNYKKKRFISGSMAYLISLFKTAMSFKGIKVNINIDSIEYEEDIYLLAVGNGQYYGGGIRIAPYANLKDGYLEVYIIKKVSFFKLLKELPKVFKGTHSSGIKEVVYIRGKNIKAISERDIIVNIDGELIKSSTIEFSIISKGVSIIMPK